MDRCAGGATITRARSRAAFEQGIVGASVSDAWRFTETPYNARDRRGQRPRLQ